MKKIVGIILAVIGIVTAAINLVFKVNGQTSVARSVSVIGGADGPTSIFLAGKVVDTSADRDGCGDPIAYSRHFYDCKKKITSLYNNSLSPV